MNIHAWVLACVCSRMYVSTYLPPFDVSFVLFTGVRTFTPMSISTLLSSVGGTNVMLGLVAMATTAECLYASVKALVCTVGGNSVALKDMERSGGFKVCWGSYECICSHAYVIWT